jgi:hypothetical protein
VRDLHAKLMKLARHVDENFSKQTLKPRDRSRSKRHEVRHSNWQRN